ncbi:MAG: glutamate--tRNA ligase [Acidaminococcaceae bacterium]|nr:glutamate--tRNA ligase [Acidaminococcaceae bacterium]HAY60856.1 glutamate--tRNA ligase [Acidaminococcaceae bacterium]HCJ91113.1 glutamate--tRNA ligase [Acidaminococcaceae bacterium]
MSEEVRVRFAPSPTGNLHVGGARTCLFNWLFARSTGGKLVLRIEDTDPSRFKPGSVEQIIRSMKWLGLDWDEGPEVGGPGAPYFQSQRTEIYQKYLKQLLDEGKAYYCFCTPEELEKQREIQKARKQPFRYPRTCRNLSKEEVERRLAAGEPHSIRFKMPMKGNMRVHDLIHGRMDFDMTQFDDFVIAKTNGTPTYNFAVVIDDHLMGMTHVLRAEEHIPNTPKQILLYEALGFEVPQFGHMSMILAPDRSKLSKRHGAQSVEEFQAMGYLPEALLNYLLLLGWSPDGDQEIITKEEAVRQFRMERMSHKGAVYDIKKLYWINGQYLNSLPLERIVKDAQPFFVKAGLVTEDWFGDPAHGRYFTHLVEVLRVRVKTLQEIVDASTYFFRDFDEYDAKGVRKFFTEEGAAQLAKCRERIAAAPADAFNEADLEKLYNAIAEEDGVTLGKVVQPSRLALSGRTVTPGMFDVMVLLGRDKTLERMDKALAYIRTLPEA